MNSVSNVNEVAPLLGINGENQTHMDPKLFEGAAEGNNIEPFKDFTEELIKSSVTKTKYTILHINIISQIEEKVSTKFVEEILEMYPFLLLQVNVKGATTFHVAEKGGLTAIVRALIDCAKNQHIDLESGEEVAKKIIRATNNDKNTALHKVVRHGNVDVVKILTKEDPDFLYSANNNGQTPLYIAAAKGSSQMVLEILENCISAAHDGPSGKTALHAAVMTGNSDVVKQILEKKKSLIKETDEHGWTPLHYAAYHYHPVMVKQLLEFDQSIAFTADKDRKMAALHLATGQGYAQIIEEIISLCPQCYELTDDKGWNVRHFAMVSLGYKNLKNLSETPLVSSLINEEDAKGNTPLHMLATSRRSTCDSIINCYSKSDSQAVNKQNLSVEHVLRYGFPELEKTLHELSKDKGSGQYSRGVIQRRELEQEDLKIIEKARESHLVVSALIATVAFAAALTVPGAYQSEKGSDQGTAILRRNSKFHAFIITYTIAMVFSLSAVFVHFIMSIPGISKLVGRVPIPHCLLFQHDFHGSNGGCIHCGNICNVSTFFRPCFSHLFHCLKLIPSSVLHDETSL